MPLNISAIFRRVMRSRRSENFRRDTRDVTLLALECLQQSAYPCPPLKGAVSGLLFLVQHLKKLKANREQAQLIVHRVESITKILALAIPDSTAVPAHLESALVALDKALQDACKLAQSVPKATGVRRLLRAKKHEEQLASIQRQLDSAQSDFTTVGVAWMSVELGHLRLHHDKEGSTTAQPPCVPAAPF
ncbi:hypothetical protein BC834DRAFT_969137 [Gloeopeniophorella convolvens]|nr:hypothetical protein BC834DRAFT_969137 [Gloeopeniophorella convolvens]